MFRSPSLRLHCVTAPNTVLLLSSLLSSPSVHVCVCLCTGWICLRGEEGGIKSVERTWQLLFSLSLHCFGPPQILFHGAKHPLPGISTAPISRRRFKPLSWHPDWAWREEACDAHQHRQRHKTHLLSLLREGPASCSVCVQRLLTQSVVSQAVLAATLCNLWHESTGHTWTCEAASLCSLIHQLKNHSSNHWTHSETHSVK